jgi:hypothetical protein
LQRFRPAAPIGADGHSIALSHLVIFNGLHAEAFDLVANVITAALMCGLAFQDGRFCPCAGAIYS